jgi:hypothetical protein
MKNKTLILGASEQPSRYSNLALKRLLAHGHSVLAIGKTEGSVNGIQIHKSEIATDEVDTVTLYLNPDNQKRYYEYILSLKPRRIIFNPGTENIELETLAEDAGITTLEACTLVMLSTGQY